MNEQEKDKKQDKPGRHISRRILLGGAATAAVVLLKSSYGQVVQKAITQAELKISDPTKVLGQPPGEVGTRSKFEKPVKKTSDTSSRTPLQDLFGTITPSDLHYERHHAGVPVIDPNNYSLTIHGMVDNPLTFSLADKKRFPSVTIIFFLEC